jgi:hypothetical protein
MCSQELLDYVSLDSATSIDLEAVIYRPHPNSLGVSTGTAGFASYRPAAAASSFAGRIGVAAKSAAEFVSVVGVKVNLIFRAVNGEV